MTICLVPMMSSTVMAEGAVILNPEAKHCSMSFPLTVPLAMDPPTAPIVSASIMTGIAMELRPLTNRLVKVYRNTNRTAPTNQKTPRRTRLFLRISGSARSGNIWRILSSSSARIALELSASTDFAYFVSHVTYRTYITASSITLNQSPELTGTPAIVCGMPMVYGLSVDTANPIAMDR